MVQNSQEKQQEKDLCEEKLKQYFSKMIVYKSPANVKMFSELGLPSYIRDWLVMRFSDENGIADKAKIADYAQRFIPNRDQWNIKAGEMLQSVNPVRFLAKVKTELDIRSNQVYFYLPDLDAPKHKGEGIVDWNIVEENKEFLLASHDVWGIVDLVIEPSPSGKSNIIKLVGFQPFRPYSIKLDYFRKARSYFTTEEWIDILIRAADYNPQGYENNTQKCTLLKRLLPFVENRLNLIELAPKETGKSYIFSHISKYGWLVSGGSVTRAKMFYDNNRKSEGLVSEHDYVALDEIQSICFENPSEMQGVLKGYLESGEYYVGLHRGVGNAGMVLLGNIDSSLMSEEKNMFSALPSVFRESALLDRFHGFIKGWDIPKMREELKADGWALNTEYFGEILHLLRKESVYRSVVDALLIFAKDSSTRDTEAIKRLCTAYVKLLFPHIESPEQVNREEFLQYCLLPSIEMRKIIKMQMGIIDPGEFGKAAMPQVQIKN